jgi:hypothetical protein
MGRRKVDGQKRLLQREYNNHEKSIYYHASADPTVFNSTVPNSQLIANWNGGVLQGSTKPIAQPSASDPTCNEANKRITGLCGARFWDSLNEMENVTLVVGSPKKKRSAL